MRVVMTLGVDLKTSIHFTLDELISLGEIPPGENGFRSALKFLAIMGRVLIEEKVWVKARKGGGR